ncbi:MAG: flagellar basal-body rod protein FlgG [Elusimicrobiales bacterium]|nr:flagellar basal-body rod protein FlgG [Elusimicrobiales bacterium]
MIRALLTASSGLKAQQTNLDIIANNLANVNTTSFKKSRAEFKDLGYIDSNSLTSQSKQLEIGIGVELSSTKKLFFQGSLLQTSNSLDIAIEGNGFLKVRDFDGSIKYTRDGSLRIDSEGRLITSSGRILEPEILIPQNSKEISISENGVISVVLNGESKPTEIGRIELTIFPNPSGLKSIGGNLYEETNASGESILAFPSENGAGIIKQGFLESSNVDIVDEMVRMLSAQRAFEINSKAMETADEMLKIVNNLKP